MKTKVERDWASIPKQTFLGGREDGIPGDCWRCCIAAVLGVPAASVPHFYDIARRDSDRNPDGITQKWLNERGFLLMRTGGGWVGFPNYYDKELQTSLGLELPVIECGTTHRTKKPGQHHAVVTVGGRLVYDPHPDGEGLTYTTERYFVLPANINPLQT